VKPSKVNILGIEYSIEYVNSPSDVDIHKRESAWGQIDYWTRSIRIYDNGHQDADIWQTIFHEVLHGIACHLKIEALGKGDAIDPRKHDDLDLLALALVDTLFRNGWMQP